MFRSCTQRGLAATRSAAPNRPFAPIRQLQSSSRRPAEDKSDTAFSPNETRPEQEKERAAQASGKDSKSNATGNVNPANPTTSAPRDSEEGGSQGSAREEGSGGIQRSGQSGGGSPRKDGGAKSGGGGAGTS